jgi:hypothetical protein
MFGVLIAETCHRITPKSAERMRRGGFPIHPRASCLVPLTVNSYLLARINPKIGVAMLSTLQLLVVDN